MTTIWGESAGAGSIMNQIIANVSFPRPSSFAVLTVRLSQGGNTVKALGLKQPLFHAAIGSSVFLPYQAKYNSPFAEKLYSQLVSATNCTNAASSFACLEALDAAVLAAAALKNSAAFPFGFWSYVPVVDGTFLTERASLLLAKGKKNLNGVCSTPSTVASPRLTPSRPAETLHRHQQPRRRVCFYRQLAAFTRLTLSTQKSQIHLYRPDYPQRHDHRPDEARLAVRVAPDRPLPVHHRRRAPGRRQAVPHL